MINIDKLATVLQNLDRAYSLVLSDILAKEKQERLYKELKELGALDSVRPGNPTTDIGAALRLAQRYGITINPSTSFGSVIAEYPPEFFPKGRRFNSFFVDPPPDWVTGNSAWIDRITVQEAVCECVIMCLRSGLVNKND